MSQKTIQRPYLPSSSAIVRPPSVSKMQGHSTTDPPTQMSLRDVLGEKLEKEILSDGGTAEFNIKDDPPSSSARQRWSVSTFPPQLTSSSTIPPSIEHAGGIFTGAGAWSNTAMYPHGRHSITAGTVDGGPLNGDNTSWPTWPGILSQQSQSYSLPSGLAVDSRWSPLPDQEVETSGGGGEAEEAGSDLDELMKSLDIADHIPALKVCNGWG